MGREERLYPLSEEQFTEVVVPIIQASYRGKGSNSDFNHQEGGRRRSETVNPSFCGSNGLPRSAMPRKN
jgi:hypothetical protein